MEVSRMSARYTPTAIWLHWLTFLILVGLVTFGFYVHGLHFSPTRIRLVNYHKWAGVTFLLLVLLRLVWRWSHLPPALPVSMAKSLKVAAAGAHWALYAVMILIPISGWLMSSAKGYQTVWFGILPLPNLVQRNAVLGAQLLEVHLVLNVLLIILVAGHAAAAIKHHVFDKDDVLTRMLPGRTRSDRR
jgi:cytochrome b561